MTTHIKHFYLSPLAKAGFKPTEMLLLNLVLTFRNTPDKFCMGKESISDHINVGKTTISNTFKDLKKNGWINIKYRKVDDSKQNDTNIYTPTAKLLKLVGISKNDTGISKKAPKGIPKSEQNILSEKNIGEQEHFSYVLVPQENQSNSSEEEYLSTFLNTK